MLTAKELIQFLETAGKDGGRIASYDFVNRHFGTSSPHDQISILIREFESIYKQLDKMDGKIKELTNKYASEIHTIETLDQVVNSVEEKLKEIDKEDIVAQGDNNEKKKNWFTRR